MTAHTLSELEDVFSTKTHIMPTLVNVHRMRIHMLFSLLILSIYYDSIYIVGIAEHIWNAITLDENTYKFYTVQIYFYENTYIINNTMSIYDKSSRIVSKYL